MAAFAPGGILALDLSGVVGWAYGLQSAERPMFGTWILPRTGNRGARFVAFENELIAALDMFEPGAVCMEAPLPPQAQNNVTSAYQQIGMASYVEGECWRRDIVPQSVASSTARALVLGRGRFPKGQAKPEVLAWCRSQGLLVPDDNAADAIVVWEYFRRQQTQRRAA